MPYTRKYPSKQKTTTKEGRREYKRLQMRAIRKKRREKGLCTKCGQPKCVHQLKQIEFDTLIEKAEKYDLLFGD